MSKFPQDQGFWFSITYRGLNCYFHMKHVLLHIKIHFKNVLIIDILFPGTRSSNRSEKTFSEVYLWLQFLGGEKKWFVSFCGTNFLFFCITMQREAGKILLRCCNVFTAGFGRNFFCDICWTVGMAFHYYIVYLVNQNWFQPEESIYHRMYVRI